MAGSTLNPPAAQPLGVYIHVPFCRVHCPYCDFHTYPAGRGRAPDFVQALLREIDLAPQRVRPASHVVETVYFGGGTPSTLDRSQLASILGALGGRFRLGSGAEITLEANPEDVSPEALSAWRSLGINRVSLGVQTFDPRRLGFLGRMHTAAAAEAALGTLESFPNWSADLMFGWEDQTPEELADDLDLLLAHKPPHVSLYQLTLEPKTRLGVLASRNLVRCADSDRQADLYQAAIARLAEAGLGQYEVSNFARAGRESRHNRSYWERRPYLGLGPSAASFLGERRTRNIASWPRYAKRLRAGLPAVESVEVLTPEVAATEIVWLGLRTSSGIPLESVAPERAPLVREAARQGLVTTGGDGRITLTHKGMAVADEVSARLLSTEIAKFAQCEI